MSMSQNRIEWEIEKRDEEIGVLRLKLRDMEERNAHLIKEIASGRAFLPPAPVYYCINCAKAKP